MNKVNALIILLAGFGLNYLGNTMSSTSNGGIADILGTGIGISGSLLVFYSIYRGLKWIWNKVTGKKIQKQ